MSAQSNISRRTMLTSLTGAVVASALVACGAEVRQDDSKTSTKGSESPTTQSGSSPKGPGGHLIVVFPNQEEVDAKGLDPNIGAGATYVNSIYGSIYDQLVYQDPTTGEPVPGLATWDVSDDGLKYTFHIRKEAKFHDGSPVTADDVLFSLKRASDPKYLPGNSTGVSIFKQFDHATVLDDKTIEVVLKSPSANFLWSAVGRTYAAIVPKAYVEKIGDEAFNQERPMGSGPFKFVEWEHGSHIRVEKNPDYTWGPKFFKTAGGPPNIDSIEFRFIIDPSTRIAALRSGQVSAIQGIPPFDQAALLADSTFEVKEVRKNGQPGGLFLNTRAFPISELPVRQALALVVDRKELNSTVFAGVHFPIRTVLEEKMGQWVNTDAQLPETAVEEAKSVLDQAGWTIGADGIREKDGKRLRLVAATSENLQQAMTMIQDQAKRAGIEIEVQVGSSAQISDLAQAKGDGDYHLLWQLINGRTNEDPYVLRTMYHTNSIPGGSEGVANASRYSNPEIDRLLDSATGEMDNDKRKGLYHAVQKILVDNVVYLPLLSINQNWAVVKGVSGLTSDARGTYTYFHDVEMAPELAGRWNG
jgi:peptide/nickel transport system substrate-binding protein